MEQCTRSLDNHRAPGTTGVEFKSLAEYPRDIIVSSPAEGQVFISVGCYRVQFTTEEAIAIGTELVRLAREATPKAKEEEIRDRS